MRYAIPHGPVSLIRTVTERPLCGFVTVRVVPRGQVRERLARRRYVVARQARRIRAVERQIAAVAARRQGSGLLTHPFGAPPVAAIELVSAGRVHQGPMAGG